MPKIGRQRLGVRLSSAAFAFPLAATLALSATPLFHNIRDYGAAGDQTWATTALQKAIDDCASQDGGKVVIPPGRYLIGPIFLKSHVQIELEPGAVLLGSTNISDYPAIDGRWEGVERKVYASLFNGNHLENVSITGRGVIDGQGSIWWDAHRQTSELRRQKGIKGREPENPPDAPLRWPRPRLINFYNCTNVLIQDVTLLNSPSWTIHPVYCENMTIDNVTILNPSNSPNTDAVDPDSCRDVRISNSRFDVGDDCVVIKSGYNEDGRRVGIPCEDILVNNCTFLHGHGGVVIGSEMSGSVRNVTVANCVFDGTQRGLRVKTSLGRGGVIENFRASNLVMRNITDAAFSITAAYDRDMGETSGTPAPEVIPIMRHIHWSEAIVSGVNRVADLSGMKESPLEDVSLRNIEVTSCTTGIHCANANDILLENITLQPTSGSALTVQDVTNLDVIRLVVPDSQPGLAVVSFRGVSQALVRGSKISGTAEVFLDSTGGRNQSIGIEGNRLPAKMKKQLQ
jgi:hypothetical protein